MTTTIQIKRHQTGAALVVGTAPLKASSMLPGEMVNDEVANILYIAIGNDGTASPGPYATNIISIGGAGAFLASGLLGAVNGVASLDSGGKLPVSQLPASVVGGLNYQGTWNPNTNSPKLVSGTGTKGYMYKVSAAAAAAILNVTSAVATGSTTVQGTGGGSLYVGMLAPSAYYPAGTTVTAINGTTITLSAANTVAIPNGTQLQFLPYLDGVSQFSIGDLVAFDGTAWDRIDGPAEAVLTVAGRIGNVILNSNDLTDVTALGRSLMVAASHTALVAALALTVADVSGAAPLASPPLTGTPTAPTPASGDNTTKLATTAFVAQAVAAATVSAIDGGVI